MVKRHDKTPMTVLPPFLFLCEDEKKILLMS
jgi:hypothetical protein